MARAFRALALFLTAWALATWAFLSTATGPALLRLRRPPQNESSSAARARRLPDAAGAPPWPPPAPAGPNRSAAPPPAPLPVYAYVTIVGTARYLDGGLALGHSLRRHSPCLARCTARFCCALAVLVPRGAPNSTVARLSHVFQAVLPVDDLSALAPSSYWKFSLNKVHLPGLVQYARVAFFDADSLALRSPDAVFDTPLSDPSWVGAFASGAAFTTETFVLVWPNATQAAALRARLVAGLRDGGPYTGRHARDTPAYRDHFGRRFVRVARRFSDTEQDGRLLEHMVVFHYYGGFKPWMDAFNPFRYYLTLYLQFNTAYSAWWDAYQSLHREAAAAPGSGARATHLELMPGDGMAYARPVAELGPVVRATGTTLAMPGMQVVVADLEEARWPCAGLACGGVVNASMATWYPRWQDKCTLVWRGWFALFGDDCTAPQRPRRWMVTMAHDACRRPTQGGLRVFHVQNCSTCPVQGGHGCRPAGPTR